jgi:hypothetical protein
LQKFLKGGVGVKDSILKRYPELKFDDVVLRDDGDERGIYIDVWNSDKPKPTIDEVNQWVQEDAALPKPLSDVEQLQKDQADLTFQLMLKGVL